MWSKQLFQFAALATLVAPFVSADAHADSHAKRHRELAHRPRGDVQLHKRFDNARFTFYDVGMGACGQNNVASDFIVALNTDQYGGGYPGPHCFAMITITANGKTTTAQIMDECPGCPYGGLDFSRGLFDFFAAESVGVLYGTWYFNDGSGGGDSGSSSSSEQQWTSTSEWVAPTTTWQDTTWWQTTSSTDWWTPTTTSDWWTSTSSTWTPETSSTWSSSSEWSSSSSSWSSSSAWSSSSVWSSSSSSAWSSSATVSSTAAAATVTLTSTSEDPQNINALNQAVMGLSGIIVAGAQA